MTVQLQKCKRWMELTLKEPQRVLLEEDRPCLALPGALHCTVERDAKENITNVEMSEITCCMCLWANSHTVIILLRHDWNQTTLSGCVHLSSIQCYCISLFTLQDDQNNSNTKLKAQIQSTTQADSRARIELFLEHAMIILMHSSTEGAVWHSMVVRSFSMLLMLHVSHFSVSAGPTAHHLMAVDVVDEACSGRQGKL